MSADTDQLNLLAVFHYVLAGICGLFSCLPIFHLGFGIAMVLGQFPFPDHNGPPPEVMGWIFIAFAASFMAIGWTYTICVLMAGRCLQRHSGYTFCLVMAALSCMFIPVGTCLGVFTIVVLMRPSVKALFENPPATELEWNSAGQEPPRSDTSRSDSSSTF